MLAWPDPDGMKGDGGGGFIVAGMTRAERRAARRARQAAEVTADATAAVTGAPVTAAAS